MSDIVDDLRNLIPELKYSRDTHIQWRDAEPKHFTANPNIGDRDFHRHMVGTYDKRIETIRRAIVELQAVKELEKIVIAETMHKAPCNVCGYNGPDYFNPGVHPCAKIWHEMRGTRP